MPLKLGTPDTILWPVTVYTPRDDGTKDNDEIEIKIRYKYLSMSDRKKAIDEDLPVRDYIKGWELNDIEGKAVPFNKKNLDEVLDLPNYEAAIIGAFLTCQNGAKTKN